MAMTNRNAAGTMTEYGALTLSMLALNTILNPDGTSDRDFKRLDFGGEKALTMLDMMRDASLDTRDGVSDVYDGPVGKPAASLYPREIFTTTATPEGTYYRALSIYGVDETYARTGKRRQIWVQTFTSEAAGSDDASDLGMFLSPTETILCYPAGMLNLLDTPCLDCGRIMDGEASPNVKGSCVDCVGEC